MLNLARFQPVLALHKIKSNVIFVEKIGAGIMLPHPENTIFGNTANVGPKTWSNFLGWNHGWWQVGGWTAGVEYGLQWMMYNRGYLELTDKETYTSFSGIQVYEGRANQTVWMNQ